ncbi:MAG TPA: ATP-binding cassette domain-containing protein [Rubrobacteraceae bacterium]|nr:ATP-binding cassette domain-containing protein [Rubrobacteraceae bacterium]
MLDLNDKKEVRSGYPLLSVDGARSGYEVQGRFNVAVGDVSFDIWRGEMLILLGPSGCGKSTLLKAVAGFIEPDGGSISFAGRDGLEPGPDLTAKPYLPLPRQNVVPDHSRARAAGP